MGAYQDLKDTYICELAEIRIHHREGIKEVEWFEGVRFDLNTIPEGKHAYETRHEDNDWCKPISMAEEGKRVKVNYCGTIVSDEDLNITEETKIMFLGKQC